MCDCLLQLDQSYALVNRSGKYLRQGIFKLKLSDTFIKLDNEHTVVSNHDLVLGVDRPHNEKNKQKHAHNESDDCTQTGGEKVLHRGEIKFQKYLNDAISLSR